MISFARISMVNSGSESEFKSSGLISVSCLTRRGGVKEAAGEGGGEARGGVPGTAGGGEPSTSVLMPPGGKFDGENGPELRTFPFEFTGAEIIRKDFCDTHILLHSRKKNTHTLYGMYRGRLVASQAYFKELGTPKKTYPTSRSFLFDIQVRRVATEVFEQVFESQT